MLFVALLCGACLLTVSMGININAGEIYNKAKKGLTEVPDDIPDNVTEVRLD